MIQTEEFELNIPTHIRFTLYRYDYIDGILISTLTRECENISIEENVYTIAKDSFEYAIKNSPRLKKIAKKTELLKPGTKQSVNSLFFLWQIVKGFPNIEFLSFTISKEKEFSRVVRVGNNDVVNFIYYIEEGFMDLTQILPREDLDLFNRQAIKHGMLTNRYLNRSPYFYSTAELVFNVVEATALAGSEEAGNLLEFIDPKLESDNPILLVKTDYSIY
jgi:hypothetical protein